MAENRRKKNSTGGVSVSIPGLLAVMAGLTILYLYWTMGWSVHIRSGVSRIVLLGSALLFIVWGANEIALGTLVSFRGRRQSRRSDFDFELPPPSRRIGIGIGLGLMALGVTFGTLMALRAESSLTVVVGITLGIFVFAAGLRKTAAALQRDVTRKAVRRHQLLTLPGIAYLGIMITFMIGALLGRSNMLMLMFALMAGPFVINGGITLRMLRQVSVTRDLPDRVMAGDIIDIDLTVENGKRFMSAAVLDCADLISGQGEELQTGILFARVPPKSKRTGTYRFRPMRRGRYRFGPITISSRFPLGFVERGLKFATRDDLIVYPRLGRLTSHWERDSLIATELVEAENARRGIYDDEFHRLREHRWGDNPRAIHWRSSAKRNELMVREYEQNRDRDLIVLLDLWAPEKPNDDDLERVELAISFAATICVEQMQQSRESMVTLVSAGYSIQRWQGQAGELAFDSLLTQLAMTRAGEKHSLGDLLDQEAEIGSPGTRVILISTSAERLAASSETTSVGIEAVHLERYAADWPTVTRYLDLPTQSGHSGGRA